MTKQHWHAYGCVAPEYGAFMTLIVGPTEKGPDDLDNNGTRVRDATVGDAPYLTSFDHEPSDLEKDRLQPEEYRELDEEGHVLEPAIDITRRSPDGIEVTSRHPLSDVRGLI